MGDCCFLFHNHCHTHRCALRSRPSNVRKRGLQLQSSTGYSRVSIQSWDRCSVMARPGTLWIATVTVLVILAAAVQPGAVAYLEEVPWDPWNPLFWRAAFENTMCKRALAYWHSLYKFYFAARDGNKLHISMRALIYPRLTRITNCFAASICGPKRSQALLWPKNVSCRLLRVMVAITVRHASR